MLKSINYDNIIAIHGVDIMRIISVNKDYFKNVVGSSTLNLDQESKDIFGKYAGIKNAKNSDNLTSNEILKNLKVKFDSDLKEIRLSTWKFVSDLVKSVYVVDLPLKYYRKDIKVEDLVKQTLKVYKEADMIDYQFARKLLDDKDLLIYLNNVGLNQYYDSEEIGKKLISITNSGYYTYVRFTHELGHAINEMRFSELADLFSEASPIFYEILMCDYLNQEKDYKGLYNYRIAMNTKMITYLIEYVKVLDAYVNNNCVLSLDNASRVLGVSNNEELIRFYKKFNEEECIDLIKYLLSSMVATSAREKYLDNKKLGIDYLNDITVGNSKKLNLYESLDAYNRHIKSLKG